MSLRPGPTATSIGLALALALPSLGTVQKYAGTALALAYLLAAVVLAPLAIRHGVPAGARLGERRAWWLALGTYLALVIAFAVVYPLVDLDSTLAGSDRDEAANLGARRLVAGEWPYEPLTYLGNPISNLPGALVLSSPFVLLGNSAYQNLLWLPLLFAGLAWRVGSARVALSASWLLLLASPVVLREFFTGGDLLANSIYVTLLMLAVFWAGASRPRRHGVAIVLAILLGVALSSRANFLFGVPLLFAALARHGGRRAATELVGAALAAFTAVTLPFYLADRHGFTPLKTVNHLRQFEDVLPHAHVVVIAAAAVLTLALALAPSDARGDALMLYCAILQGFLVAWPVTLASIRSASLDFSFLVAGFGLPLVFFAVFAAWGRLRGGQLPPPTPAG